MMGATYQGLRSFACSTCGAEVGRVCRTLTTGLPTEPHASRYKAEGAFLLEKAPCLTCGMPVMRSYMWSSGVCTECE